MNESGNWKQRKALHVCAGTGTACVLAGASERQLSGRVAGSRFHNFFLCFFSKAGGDFCLAAGEV